MINPVVPDNLVVLVKRENLAPRPITSLGARSNIKNFRKKMEILNFCSIFVQFLRKENRNSPEGDKIEFLNKIEFLTLSTLDD